MAYSRWGDSIWYCFWVNRGGKKYKFPTQKLKNEEIFEICDLPSFCVNYGSLKRNGIDETLKEIKDYYSKEHPCFTFNGEKISLNAKNPTDEEIEELRGYLEQFIKDVDDYFKFWNYIYNEWYLGFKNQIFIKKQFKKNKKS